jgi:hypothetical protein
MNRNTKKSKSPEEKFNESIGLNNRGKKFNPYNNTGNYLKKTHNFVSPNENVYIYLDKYKSKTNQEDDDVPYGFYIINHSDPNLKGLFFNIVIPKWVEDSYPEIKGSLQQLGSLTVEELHDEQMVKRIEYHDMVDANGEQNPEICESISKYEEKTIQTNKLLKKIEKLRREIAEKEDKNEYIQNGLSINENKKKIQTLRETLQKNIQLLENIDSWKSDTRMLITPKFRSMIDTDHPTKICSKTYDRSPWWDQQLFEQSNDWEGDWYETEDDEVIPFKSELENLNKIYCQNKNKNETACTTSKPWYKTSVDQLCDFQPGYLRHACNINPEKAKILVKEREKMYDDCMYRQSCQTDAGLENGIPKYFKPYMTGKYFNTVNKDIPICCKRSLVAVVENVLTIKKLEKVFGYKPSSVFQIEIKELGLEPSIEKFLIKNHEKDEKYLQESILQEENISNSDEIFYNNIGKIVTKYIEEDFDKIINNTSNVIISQKEDPDPEVEDENTETKSIYTQIKSSISSVFGEVKKISGHVLEKIVEIMKKCAKWLFLHSGPFVMALKWLCDTIKVGLCVGACAKLISDFLELDFFSFGSDKKESCESKCKNSYNENIDMLNYKYRDSYLREEAAKKAKAESEIEAKKIEKQQLELDMARAVKRGQKKTTIIPERYTEEHLLENPEDDDWFEDDEYKTAKEEDSIYKKAKKEAEYEKQVCELACKGQSYLLGGRPLTEYEEKKERERDAIQKKLDSRENVFMKKLKGIDYTWAIENGTDAVSRIIADRSLANIKSVASEKLAEGNSLLRDKITTTYLDMKSKISDLSSFITFTLVSTSTFFQETFKHIWDKLVLILSSVLESILKTITWNTIDKLNIPIAKTATIFFEPFATVVSNKIYHTYFNMIKELESAHPNSSVVLFFKDWQLCCLDKITLFDMSKITLTIEITNLSNRQGEMLEKKMKFNCKSTDTISLIKANLQEQLNLSMEQPVLLTFKNATGEKQALVEEKTIKDYNIKNNSTLELTSVVDAKEATTRYIDGGGKFKMSNLYDDQVLNQLFETYKKKHLSKKDKLYLRDILVMILNNVNPRNYTQSHKNILLLLFKN